MRTGRPAGRPTRSARSKSWCCRLTPPAGCHSRCCRRCSPLRAPPASATRRAHRPPLPLASRLAPHHPPHYPEKKTPRAAPARRFGFGGGLVPGVDVYAYMPHMPVARWGRAWLDHGTAECRFFKPVYDGDTVTVTATETADGLDIAVESRGEVCPNGQAALPAAPPPPPAPDAFPRAPQRSERPAADEASLVAGSWLGIEPYPVTAEAA